MVNKAKGLNSADHRYYVQHMILFNDSSKSDAKIEKAKAKASKTAINLAIKSVPEVDQSQIPSRAI